MTHPKYPVRVASSWTARTLVQAENELQLPVGTISQLKEVTSDWQRTVMMYATLESLAGMALKASCGTSLLALQAVSELKSLSRKMRLLADSVSLNSALQKVISEEAWRDHSTMRDSLRKIEPLFQIRNAYAHDISVFKLGIEEIQARTTRPVVSKAELNSRFEEAVRVLTHLILNRAEEEAFEDDVREYHQELEYWETSLSDDDWNRGE